jgi:hypothetical protein
MLRDSVASNDDNDAGGVQCSAYGASAFNDLFFFQYEANHVYKVTLIRIFIKLLNIDFEQRQTANSIVKCARSKPCNRKRIVASSAGRAEPRYRGST